MSKSLTLLVPFSLCHLAPGQAPTEDLQMQWSRALRIQVSRCEAIEAPGEAANKAVARLTGGKVVDLARARFYRGHFESARPPAKGVVHLCCLPLAGAEGEVVAAVDEHDAVRVARFGKGMTLDLSWRRFVVQFQNRRAPRLADARTHADVSMRRAALERSKDPKDIVTLALISQRSQMLGILDPLMTTMQHWSGVEAGKDQALKTIELLERYGDLSEKLKPVLGSKAADYAKISRRVANRVRTARRAAADGGDPREVLRSLRSTCNACHKLEVPRSKSQGWREFAARLRHERGFGDDYYLVGHDARRLGLSATDAQATATAIRGALLLIDTVRSKTANK